MTELSASDGEAGVRRRDVDKLSGEEKMSEVCVDEWKLVSDALMKEVEG